MVHDEYKEMLPALALSALDAEDARAVNQHLSECAECRRELADWENTAASLSLTANPAEPSPEVRDRIMRAVRKEKAARVVPFPKAMRDRKTWTSFGSVGAVAAAVLIGILILWIVVLSQQNRALRSDMDTLTSRMQSLEEDIRRSDQFVELMSTPGARVAALRGSGPGSGASGQVVYDRAGRVMLLAGNLPPAPQGKEYQLWFIVGNNPPVPGRTFVPDQLGQGTVTDEAPRAGLDSAVFAITLEPAGGSSAPTSAIYLRSGI